MVILTPSFWYGDIKASGYWLGGYRSLPNNIWVWTDGSDSTFMPWAPGLYNL